MLVGCILLAMVGSATLHFIDNSGTWTKLIVGWLFFTPLWAVATAWLGREEKESAEPPPPPTRSLREVWRGPFTAIPEVLRLAMCASAILFFVGLRYFETWTWIPLILLAWMLGHVADLVEGSSPAATVRSGELLIKRLLDALLSRRSLVALVLIARRQVAAILTFLYVCLAWVFFRAPTFDDALAVLRQIAKLEFDHANLVPLVTVPLVAGFVTHFFADGGYRWLRDRFCALPPPAQGLVLAGCGLVLRELAHTKIVPFIYFQF